MERKAVPPLCSLVGHHGLDVDAIRCSARRPIAYVADAAGRQAQRGLDLRHLVGGDAIAIAVHTEYVIGT